MKTAICGYSGSGKSTLARRIGEIEQVPVLYLDTVQFVANWQERDRDEARSIVRAFMKQENWVIDGNYTNFFYQERMEAADRILILVFNRFTCLYRAFKRYFRYRNQTRESMAEGCKEKNRFGVCAMDPEKWKNQKETRGVKRIETPLSRKSNHTEKSETA